MYISLVVELLTCKIHVQHAVSGSRSTQGTVSSQSVEASSKLETNCGSLDLDRLTVFDAKVTCPHDLILG